jgi:hypothetical protein
MLQATGTYSFGGIVLKAWVSSVNVEVESMKRSCTSEDF